jgi:hypothetical protein
MFNEASLYYGLGICVLTKGGRRALRDLDLFRPVAMPSPPR